MNHLLKVQQLLIPDLIEKMYRRYLILDTIHLHQPIGRRALSDILLITERVLRSEIDLLKAQGLVNISSKGMTITDEGIDLLSELQSLMEGYAALESLSQQIKLHYGLNEVIVVNGNVDTDDIVKNRLGEAASNVLQRIVQDGDIVSVTGGSTMLSVANQLKPLNKRITFTPARGGLGEDLSFQANAVVQQMAEHGKSQFEVLYVPDQVSEEAYKTLVNEPSVKRVLDHIKHANILIHGVGDAMKMAKRRHSSNDDFKMLDEQQAVAEAFGYYFNAAGVVVHKVRTIGIQLDDLNESMKIIAVAGGSTKQHAIEAYLKVAPKHTILIIDSTVAHWLTQQIKQQAMPVL
ncbi:sugar-binding transcriptional regulator [Macrococcus animalis]|uniref:sugar-binding transcriptional regulator n=1 Tax=Macrococcus animalis TaxID=3395467 RepID=UPI0039BE8D45